MNETIFSINGKIVPEEQAVVPVTDRGFLYGDGLFETLHAYGRTVFRLKEHLARLENGLRVLGIEGVPPAKTLSKWIQAAVDEGGFREANLRLTVTRGSGKRGPSVKGKLAPNIVLMSSDFTRRPESDYTQGVSAIVASFRRQESSVLASLKTMNYLEQIFARREADAAGVDEALLINNAGLLCEGSASNITLVKDGVVTAPDPKLVGALPGTMQVVALELARKLKIPVCQAGLGLYDLRGCEEAFLTGSMREITPLVRIQDANVGKGVPGPVTCKLIAAYRRMIEAECKGYKFTRAY